MYRTIYTQLWTDPKIRSLTKDGKLLFLYLLTNPYTHVSGIYHLPGEMLRQQTGISDTLSDTLWHTLSDTLSIAYRDLETHTVWVVKMFQYQGQGPKNEQAAAKHLQTLHHSSLIPLFLKHYPSVSALCPDTLSIPYRYPFQNTPSVPVPSSLDSSALNRKSDLHLKSKTHSKEFDQFWSLYPKKIGKGKALKAWNKIHPKNGMTERIYSQVQAACLTEQWTKEDGQYIPHPATWLNEARWDDDYTARSPQQPGLNVAAFLKGDRT